MICRISRGPFGSGPILNASSSGLSEHYPDNVYDGETLLAWGRRVVRRGSRGRGFHVAPRRHPAHASVV
ncbi:hypothetical protein CHELA20_50422 [Hyphomicrobiales bacterium]|nr:hypothetical protein CHELA20_50422 [Hyphomicrobiales bacterium]